MFVPNTEAGRFWMYERSDHWSSAEFRVALRCRRYYPCVPLGNEYMYFGHVLPNSGLFNFFLRVTWPLPLSGAPLLLAKLDLYFNLVIWAISWWSVCLYNAYSLLDLLAPSLPLHWTSNPPCGRGGNEPWCREAEFSEKARSSGCFTCVLLLPKGDFHPASVDYSSLRRAKSNRLLTKYNIADVQACFFLLGFCSSWGPIACCLGLLGHCWTASTSSLGKLFFAQVSTFWYW